MNYQLPLILGFLNPRENILTGFGWSLLVSAGPSWAAAGADDDDYEVQCDRVFA